MTGTYLDKVPSGLIQSLPLNEVSGTAANDYSAENNDGTYSGATLYATNAPIPRQRAPLFDGVNDFVNIQAVGFNADFNGQEGSVVIWAKVASSSVWTDATNRRLIAITVNGTNFLILRKATTNNTLSWLYTAGGTSRSHSIGSQTSTDWFCMAMTWSLANNRVRYYHNGTLLTSATIGTWTGSPVSALLSTSASEVWSGHLSNYRLYNRELTADEVASLAVIDTDYGLEILVDWDNNGNYTGLYDNITAYVIETQTIDFSLGYAPYKFIADESVLTFAVDNADGRFSPENSGSVLYGDLKPNRPAQVRYQGVPLWTGTLRGLSLDGQRYSQDRVAMIECISQKEVLDRYDMYPDLLENITADEAITDVAALIGLTTDLDTGHLPMRFVGDILQSREELDAARRAMSAYELLRELMEAERGHIFFSGDGELVFRSRYALISDTVPDYVFDNIGVPKYITSVDEMINRFQVTYFPRVSSADATDVLWQNEDTIHIPAGTSRTIYALYQDEFRKSVGAKDVQTPSGSDLVYTTGTATLSVVKRAQRAELTFDNTGGGVDAVIETLIVRGRIIKSSYPAITYDEDSASIADVGLRLEAQSIRSIDNENDAIAVAELELAKRSSIAGRVESLALAPQKADGSVYLGLYEEQETTDLIQYLQLDETSGTTANDSSAENNDGSYSSVTVAATTGPIQPDKAPAFNGTNSFVNLYSVALDTDFNEQLGSIVLWIKVTSSSVWTDGAVRAVVALGADTNNYVTIYKPAASNQLIFEYKAGATTVSRTVTNISDTGWINVAITWNKASNRVRAYVNGVQQGADVTGLGVWAGALSATGCVVGAFNTGANFWSGYLSHYRLYDVELTATQIATLAEDRVSGFSYRIHDLVRVIDGQSYHDENYHITRLNHSYNVADKILNTTLELEPAYTANFWTLDVSQLGLNNTLAF